MILEHLQRYVLLDFEASSLSRESWPVEVGLAWLDGTGKPAGWSSLICPHPDWPRSEWSPASADVHGIRADWLEAAPPAAAVAQEFVTRLAGRTLVSDAPEFEVRWLDRLLATIGLGHTLSCLDYDAVTFSLFQGASLDRLYERLERLKAPHRAGPDSLRLAKAWARGLEVEGPDAPSP
ncbi:hypothetical protein LAZ40_09170 [Cereibacter sphaeroides]|uniref:3'-5' exonuclease n=1 Tax=Cereibacter sphaeroides TaxID=1063 RepID=UPI001F214FAB|nr:hypothetical protein [Cereibacter sphaeroides]MCE6959221.1 hypothetical protein [Cereibacter sphaeroides]MCE6972024.1 hypothetical protein [Cereibacter sphaeroides]